MMLITCLYILSQVSGISAVGISEGKEFLISTPSMKLPFNKGTGYPRLVLTLMSSVSNTVKVVTEGLRNTNLFLQKELNLPPFLPVKFYDKNLFFGPDQQSGNRWAYHLTGDYPFAVTVSMETDMFVAETFTAVPVSSWGSRYVITTLDKHSSVVLINGELRNKLTFTLTFYKNHTTLLVNGLERKKGDEFQIELMRYQAYSIDDCVKNDVGTLTGSSVEGILPFGVVSGNCNGYAQIEKCSSEPDSDGVDVLTGSTVAEMLLPVESLGKYFIMLCMTCHLSRGYIIMVASESWTTITFRANAYGPETEQDLREKGDWYREKKDLISIESDKPIYVMYVRYPTCILINEGGPSIMMLIPVELFYFIYKCMVPDTTMRHYIVLVINVHFRDSVQAMYFEGEDPIFGLTTHHSLDLRFRDSIRDFYFLEYEVKRGVSFILYSLTSRFGCYVHGISPYATYMHPAGFISSNINPKFCKNSEKSMKKEDFLDNDCDGKVDEEIANGKDDDVSYPQEPNPIDEDLGFYFEKGDTINAFLSNVPGNMRQENLITFHKGYDTHAPEYSTSTKKTRTTEFNLETHAPEGEAITTRAHVFPTSAKKSRTTEYNLENDKTERQAISTPAHVFSTRVKKTMATEHNSEKYTTEAVVVPDNMSQHVQVFSTQQIISSSTKKTATTEYILQKDKSEGPGIGYYLLLAMLLVVIIGVPIYVFITIQNKKSKLSIVSQKSIESFGESDVQPADRKPINAALSMGSIGQSV